jgi:predicted nucleic acid-binding protein
MRVVFDTNTVVSALLFRGALSWLVEHWRDREVAPLVCRETANELARVLASSALKKLPLLGGKDGCRYSC